MNYILKLFCFLSEFDEIFHLVPVSVSLSANKNQYTIKSKLITYDEEKILYHKIAIRLIKIGFALFLHNDFDLIQLL